MSNQSRFVYVGRRVNGKELVAAFLPLGSTDDTTLIYTEEQLEPEWGRLLLFGYNRNARQLMLRIGGIYIFEEGDKPGSYRFPKKLPEAQLRNHDRRVEQWSVEDRALFASYSVGRKTGKEPWEEALEPVRTAWRRATGLQKHVILAQAVAFITDTRRL